MKIGFLSDSHGNLQGLMTCLDRLQEEGAKQVYFLGDATGYLPSGLEVINELNKRQIPCLMGNHEAMLTGLLPLPEDKDRVYRLGPLVEAMPAEMKEKITATWPKKLELTIDNRKILLVHGRPSDPVSGYLYQDQPLEEAEKGAYTVIVTGHTHHPYVKNEGNVLLINDGSCGLPRDGQSQISCALYDTVSGQADILYISFDFKKLLDSFDKDEIAQEVTNKLLKG